MFFIRQEKRVIEYAQYRKKYWNEIWRDADISRYKDEMIRRQLFFLKQLGESALDPLELVNVNESYAYLSHPVFFLTTFI